jgi:hypothetical protein
MSADGRVVRGRPTSVLLREDYRQHRMPTLGTFKSDVVSERIAENHFSLFADTMEVCNSCHSLARLSCVANRVSTPLPVPDATRRLSRICSRPASQHQTGSSAARRAQKWCLSSHNSSMRLRMFRTPTPADCCNQHHAPAFGSQSHFPLVCSDNLVRRRS